MEKKNRRKKERERDRQREAVLVGIWREKKGKLGGRRSIKKWRR
jgi:hypothetical protein